MRAVLLPGLDGTGGLFGPFVDAAPDGIDTQVVSYPSERLLDYSELRDLVAADLPSNEPWILIAESFSTPLAVALAADAPRGLSAVVLCAGFVTSPLPRSCRLLARPWLTRGPLFLWLVRRYLQGAEIEHSGLEFRSCLRGIPPAVLAGRIELILTVDHREQLARCAAPILYVRALRDRLVGERSFREIRSIAPRCGLCAIDSPHFVLQHSPAAAWSCIRQFVEQREWGRGDQTRLS